MKIMVASAVTANCSWEERTFTEALVGELNRQGHKVDFFFLPIVNELLSLPEQMVMLGMLDVGDDIELLITIGYPAFAIPHRNKAVCLFSLVSELNEAWDTEYGILGSPQYLALKEALQQAELRCFEGTRLFCSSGLLSQDIKSRFGSSATELKMPNLHHISNIKLESMKARYVICENDLQPVSRIDLMLDAFKETDNDIELIIYIPGSELVYREALGTYINRIGIKNRVTIVHGFINENVLKKAIALLSLPYQSRRIPLAVLASLSCGIPVITTNDSGCLTELIKNDINGLVTDQDTCAISEAIIKLGTVNRLRTRLSKGCKKTRFSENIEQITRKLVEES